MFKVGQKIILINGKDHYGSRFSGMTEGNIYEVVDNSKMYPTPSNHIVVINDKRSPANFLPERFISYETWLDERVLKLLD
jgi:RAB protein geranylgeranyltransferase component A